MKAEDDITQTDAWRGLYDCHNMLGVLRRALDSEDHDDLAAMLDFEAQVRAIASKLSSAMDDLEHWFVSREKARTGGSS